jgi:hypothetical protein
MVSTLHLLAEKVSVSENINKFIFINLMLFLKTSFGGVEEE